jgi:hypothetical protein
LPYGQLQTPLETEEMAGSPDDQAVWTRRSHARKRLLVAWAIAMAIMGFVIWVVYVLVASPLFPSCGSGADFLGGVYHGGAASSASLLAAAVLGGSLWLFACTAGCVLRRRLGELSGVFATLYVVALVVLWHVSPLIWGRRYCA